MLAIVLKSGEDAPSVAVLASKKSASDKLPPGIAALFTAAPNCGKFTDTVFLARQICTSATKEFLFWVKFQNEKVLRTKDLGKMCR